MTNEVEKLDMIAKWLVKYLLDTNADTFKYTLKDFYNQIDGTKYGDFEITVKRIKSKTK